jgi:hypothetical protein
MLGNSSLAAQLLASRVLLSSIELVIRCTMSQEQILTSTRFLTTLEYVFNWTLRHSCTVYCQNLMLNSDAIS